MLAPPEPVMSDDQLKQFITNNITNPGVLYKYFASSTRPLSALILTLTISREHDPDLGEQTYNQEVKIHVEQGQQPQYR
jgi:hypothetical protein